jgi:hypothetical protein
VEFKFKYVGRITGHTAVWDGLEEAAGQKLERVSNIYYYVLGIVADVAPFAIGRQYLETGDRLGICGQVRCYLLATLSQ